MASYTVYNTNDSGTGSLRQAIIDTNNNPGADTITFDESLSGQTITLTSSELLITESVTIDGDLNDDGVADITIQRDASAVEFRIIQINDGYRYIGQDVTLDGLIITGGQLSGKGGGIYNRENLTLDNTTVSGNSTLSGNSGGGGIYSFDATLTLNNSTVSGNHTSGDCGGIDGHYDDQTLNNSTVSGNSTSGDNNSGGGICNRYGALTLNNSTVSGNSTSGGGGNGGGIYSFDATLTLNNSTISGNTTTGVSSPGGGIYATGSSTLTLRSSLISGNRADQSAGDEIALDVTTTVLADTDNLFGDAAISNADAFSGFSPNTTHSLTATSDGTNPTALADILSPLADNGGATLTHALPPGSPALDAGANPQSFDTDQRGTDYNRVIGASADIGAFESQVTVGITTTAETVNEGESSTATVTRVGETTTNPLTVQLSLGFGADLNASDIDLSGTGLSVNGSSAQLIIPAGSASASFTITAIDDLPAEALESLALTLVETPDYAIDAGATSASVGILASDTLVTTTGDSGEGSLRQAILNANAFAGADSVGFNNNLSDQTISLTSGQLQISEALTIDGDLDDDGVADITVQRDATAGGARIVQIDDGSNSTRQNVTLDGLIITGGRVNGDGGGIDNRENLTLINTTVSANTATRYAGGIASKGTLTLSNTTVSGNSTSGDNSSGGGLLSNGILTLNNATVSGNYTSGDNSSGGGIASVGTLTLNNTTVSGNYTSGNSSNGGGILFFGGSPLTLRSSLISGNRAELAGGDEIALLTTPTSLMDTDNLFGNAAISNADAFLNFTPNTSASRTATSDGTNPTALADILSPLADNGGGALTHALPPVSPALDAGANPQNFPTDQRGEGYNRVIGPAADSGAFELQNAAPQISSDNTVDVGENTTTVINVNAADDTDSEGNGLSYNLSGGDDQGAFSIDPTTGALSFSSAPDFENPTDSGGDNSYQVEVSVSDSGNRSTSQLISVGVSDVNEAPSASNNTLSLPENGSYNFNAADLGFSDPDQGNSLALVRITVLPASGELSYNNAAVTANQEIAAGDLASLVFIPIPGESGDNYASIGFQLSDGELFSSTATLNFDVESSTILRDGFEGNGGEALSATLAPGPVGVGDATLLVILLAGVLHVLGRVGRRRGD